MWSPHDLEMMAPVAAVIPPRPPAPAACREDLRLTAKEAAALLPQSGPVHVIEGEHRGRWTYGAANAVLRAAPAIRLTLAAHEAGFGLAVERRGAATVLMQTDLKRVRAWIAAQAERLGRE